MGIRDQEKHIGLVAQEVQKAIPESVSPYQRLAPMPECSRNELPV